MNHMGTAGWLERAKKAEQEVVRLRAQLQQAAIAAMQPAPQWQGIESAPRDGTRFLAWCPYVGRVIMRIDGVHRETWAIDPLGRVGCNPTHWMPLPTPPNGGSDAER